MILWGGRLWDERTMTPERLKTLAKLIWADEALLDHGRCPFEHIGHVEWKVPERKDH